jgi:hypothetical protein
MPVASSPVQASPSLAGWPLPSSRFGAESDSLVLRLAPCASRGFSQDDYSPVRPLGYMCHRHFTW